jgi:hypothetical protein
VQSKKVLGIQQKAMLTPGCIVKTFLGAFVESFQQELYGTAKKVRFE